MDYKDIEREYRDHKRPIYDVYASKVKGLLEDLLGKENIDIVQVEHRAKTVESFVSKIKRKQYRDPLSEMKDLAGVRIITYYNDDVDRIAELLHKEFTVDPDHSTDKFEELEVDEFGYRSFHLVCTLSNNRKQLPEWGAFADFPIEIQIRSALQHSWAAISHKLDYKTAAQAPKEIRRQLFRLSALLELADDQFTDIRDKSTAIVDDYKEKVTHGSLDMALNTKSLGEFIAEKVDLEKWEELGVRAGFSEDTDDPMHPASIETLFNTLDALGVKTIKEFNGLLILHKPHALDTFSRMFSESVVRNTKISAHPLDLIAFLLTIREQKRLPESAAKDYSWKTGIQETINALCKSE